MSIYPEGIHFPAVAKENLAEFYKTVVNGNINTASTEMFPREKAGPVVLICGHGSRDTRCGVVAPLLVDEFEKVLDKWELLYHPETNPDGVKVSICSHIGGHAFAGNIIYYPGNGEPSVWYGRVFPPQVQGIVHETIVKGNIIEDILRGTGLPAQDFGDAPENPEPDTPYNPFVPRVAERS